MEHLNRVHIEKNMRKSESDFPLEKSLTFILKQNSPLLDQKIKYHHKLQ